MDHIKTTEAYPLRMAILKRSQKAGVKGLEVAVVDLNVMLAMLKIIASEGLMGELVDMSKK